MTLRKCIAAAALIFALTAGLVASPVLAGPADYAPQSLLDTAVAWISQALGLDHGPTLEKGGTAVDSGGAAIPGPNATPEEGSQTLTSDDSPSASAEGGVMIEPHG